jgi:hypothetical protein
MTTLRSPEMKSFVTLGGLLLAAGCAFAQQATERYIPIGASPGISGRTAMMGTVVSYTNGVLTVSSPAYPAPHAVRMTAQTRVWLDTSAAKRPNMPAPHSVLVPGRRIEIKFADPARRDVADWVKVEMSGAP